MPLVLIVDDNPENLTVIGELLLPHCAVRVANSGRRALQLAQLAPRPDLILLDVMMPDLDGYQVLRQLRGQPETAGIPVIFLSALDSPEDEQRGLQLGAADYVAKPIRAPILLARVRSQLALQLARSSLHEHQRTVDGELQRRVAEHRQLQQATLQVLARLVGAGGAADGRQPQRLRALVRSLAQRLRRDPRFADRLDARQVELLADAAPLHDIGAYGLPADLLHKPGRLDARERVLMQAHARRGADAFAAAVAAAEQDGEQASALELLQLAGQLARSHHERWDGNGYPDGLAGEAIPLPARLLALADVYDALTSYRAHKPALSHDTAVAMMLAERARQFDPALIDAFVECHAEWRGIAARHADRPAAAGAEAAH